MNWRNLLRNNCPQCNHMLSDFSEKMAACQNCNFTISIAKFKVLTDKMKHSSKDWPRTQSNEEALNNF